MNRYCIEKRGDQIFSYLLDEGGHAVEIHCDEAEGGKGAQALVPGNIYIGRVQNVIKNIRAAFVEIAPGQVGYLPLENAEEKEDGLRPIYTKKGPSPKLQQGDELVVQVFREGTDTKAPGLTAYPCLQGTYVVLDTARRGISVSKKLDKEQREALRRLGEALEMPGAGILFRTNAAQASRQELEEELALLQDRLERIQKTAIHRVKGSCLYCNPPVWLKRLQSLSLEETEAIVAEEQPLAGTIQNGLQIGKTRPRGASLPDMQQDSVMGGKTILPEESTVAGAIRSYLRDNQPKLLDRFRLYKDPLLPMGKLYSLERELERAMSRTVWLRSGAYLVIEPTEALTVIDVNSGKCEAGKQKEETIEKINLEAAGEIARQLRLRNLSGIIIADFINMKSPQAEARVLEWLRTCLAKDPIKANVVDITPLGLVEITRKKIEKPLHQRKL